MPQQERSASHPVNSQQWIRTSDWQLQQHPYLSLLSASPTTLLGATTLEEQLFCQWYADHGVAGQGVTVEHGPWFGSLTIPTARGLKANDAVPESRKIIHVFDLFLWVSGFDPWVVGTLYQGRYRPGESFLPLYRDLTSPYEKSVMIVAHQEDLAQVRWNGEPVEFLINDAWKQLPIMTNVIAQFFPSLIKGAILFHQDYLWASESFIHVAMYRLRDFFQSVCRIRNSCAAIFRKIHDMPDGVLQQMAATRSYADFTEDEIYDAFAWSKSLFDEPEARLAVDAGLAWMLLQMGNAGAARRIFRDIKRSSCYQHPFYQFQESTLKQWGLTDVIGE